MELEVRIYIEDLGKTRGYGLQQPQVLTNTKDM